MEILPNLETISSLMSLEKIRDCLARYSRGMDRRDMEMLRSVYWSDAKDQHGSFQGSPAEFISWIEPILDGIELTQHFLGQNLIRLEGNEAFAETYYNAYHRLSSPNGRIEVYLWGRYLDRFESRDGIWKISNRLVVCDGYRQNDVVADGWEDFAFGPVPDNSIGSGTKDPSNSFWNFS
jgi:hypothetical protein